MFMLSSLARAAARDGPHDEDAIQVQHLSLAYPARRGRPAATILDDISVDVEHGSAHRAFGEFDWRASPEI